jgi:hypothetical protein
MLRKRIAVLTALTNAPKPLKRLNSVSARNTGLKSGVTETVGNYMSMARGLNCDMFATA